MRDARVEARFSFYVSPRAHDRDGDDLDRYLAGHEGFIQVSPRIAALAETCAAGAKSPRETVRRFLDFILDNLCLGAVHYDAVAAAPSDRMGARQGLVRLSDRRRSPRVVVPGARDSRPAAFGLHAVRDGAHLPLLDGNLARAGRMDALRPHVVGPFGGRPGPGLAQSLRRWIDARMLTSCMPLRLPARRASRTPRRGASCRAQFRAAGPETEIEAVATGASVLRDEVRVVSIS